MKIGFISLMRGSNWGGSEELWSKTALQAIVEGHEAESLTQSWNPISPRIAKLQEAGVATKFYHANSTRLLDRIAVKLKVKQARFQKIPALTADVYVVSGGSTWDFLHNRAIMDAMMATGKPYLLLSNNSLEAGYTLGDEERSYAIRVIEGAAKVLFVSERNRKAAERQLAHFIPGAQVVSNPISIREAVIQPYPASDQLLLSFVGSIECDFKGIDLLLEALSGELWRNRDFTLRLYGKGPQELYVKRLIALYGLQAKVSLQGHVSNVDHIWQTSQALVVSSTSEGVPMVVVEAMLSGRAVVGTDVGKIDQYVQEGETGFLVAAAKARYLSEGLDKLWQSRASLQQMGERAFAHAHAITDMNPVASFLAIIKSVTKPS